MDGTTIPILLVVVPYAICLWMLIRQRTRGPGSGQFVLALLPWCLLFIVASVPYSAATLVLAFRRIAEQGTGGLAVVGPYCVAITGGLQLGMSACLIALTAAAALQVFDPTDQPAATGPSGGDVGGWWRTLVLAATPALIAPVMWLSHMVRGIPRLVMRAADPSFTFAPGVMEQMSASLSRDLVLAVGLGAVSIVILTGAAVASVAAARAGRTDVRLTPYSWIVGAMMLAWGVWLVVGLSGDLRGFRLALR